VPGSLVRLGRTARFRQAVKAMTATLDLDAGQFSAQLVAALAALAHSMGKDLTEPDWYHVLDALLVAAVHPASWRRDNAAHARVGDHRAKPAL
jgi:hypothetical protein